MDSVYIGIGSVRGQLQIDDGIAVFSCELTEGIFGADDNGSACGSSERAGGKCAGNLKRLGISFTGQGKSVSGLQEIIGAVYGQGCAGLIMEMSAVHGRSGVRE